ncbi:protein phosphatase 2C domain-containing protein [Catenulispora pinistramenti]|nr:protein phosphatase 2C domain-containing protein [Catenulispora pinistramenti]
MALVLRYAIRSHVGLIREGNEDSGYAGPRLLAIADGMGGAAAGELASAVVMTTVSRLDAPGGEVGLEALSSSGELPVMPRGAHPGPGAPAPGDQGVPENEQTLHISQHDLAARESGHPHSAPDPTLGEPDLALLGGAVVAANERLRAIVAERPELEGMGTTLTAMLWSGGRFGMVHVGDSRAYRLREGLLEQMTADHTWVQRLIDEGRITEEEAGHHPQRSLLMRVLDGRTQVEADIGTFDAYPGDRYLLCSDGLSGFVSQETLAETLAAYLDPQQAVDALIELALRAGGPDNITCIVADTLDDGTIPGASPNEATQMLGSLTPVVVGAASEGVDQLPQFSTPATGGPGQGGGQQDEFPQNHPAGRAARLRSRRNQQNQQLTAEHPGGPVATASPQFDPAAQTMETESVPGQRGMMPGAENLQPGSPGGPGGAFGGPDGMPGGPGGATAGKRGKKGLLITGAVVVVLAAAAGGAYMYSQGQYYVTPSADKTQVLLYQGMSQLSFAASKQSMTEGPLWIESVPESKRADLLNTQSFGSKGAALNYLEQYRSAAKSCADYRHNQPPAGQQVQLQAVTGRPAGTTLPQQQNLAPSSPASRAGAPLANGPTSAPVPTPPADIPTGSSSGSSEQGSPPPQNPTSSPSAASQPTDDPRKAYCAGTTDGP